MAVRKREKERERKTELILNIIDVQLKILFVPLETLRNRQKKPVFKTHTRTVREIEIVQQEKPKTKSIDQSDNYFTLFFV